MNFQKVMNNLKDFVLRKQYPMPDSFIIIDTNESSKLTGVDDDIVKEIKVVMDGKEKSYPYSEEFLRIYAKEHRLPIFDATKMQKSQIDPIITSRPDIIEFWRN